MLNPFYAFHPFVPVRAGEPARLRAMGAGSASRDDGGVKRMLCGRREIETLRGATARMGNHTWQTGRWRAA